MKRLLRAGVLLAALAGANAFADSISPSTFSGSVDVGSSLSVSKTVTVNAGTPTSAQVDVYFLADTTGSMGGEVGAVQASASSLLSSLSGLGNVAFGVGEYKDDPATSFDPYAFRMNSNISTSAAAAQAGINLWGASGGGDIPEADLNGLTQAADQAKWRTGSQKIIVWFGDAPSHDPSLGATLSSTEAALNAQHIKVEAINVGDLDGQGQATAITKATKGTLFNGIDQSGLVAAIEDAVTSSFATYSTVGIDTSGVPAGVGVKVTPGSITGSFSRSADATYSFNVGFTGVTAGTYDFSLFGTVDGARVATESDHIVVGSAGGGGTPGGGGGGGSGVPDGGSTLIMLGAALVGIYVFRRKTKLA
jgi:VPDSG-CTERM motif/von Willebrand factor type A domain